MNKLITELQRLYFLHDQQWLSQHIDADGAPLVHPEGELSAAIVANCLAGKTGIALDLVSADAMTRTMVVTFEKAADWEQAALLFQNIQDELELPAPAISISGHRGYRLWFSLAEAISVAQARDFLELLRARYLAAMPLASLTFCPDTGNSAAGPRLVPLTPALHETTGKWSAFIDPSMGGMFVDEPGLEMAPNMDRQADILAGLKSIKTADFQRAVSILQVAAEAESKAVEQAAAGQADRPALLVPDSGGTGKILKVGTHFTDPRSFLLAVMNDSSASAGQRIKAARALLPYFERHAE